MRIACAPAGQAFPDSDLAVVLFARSGMATHGGTGPTLIRDVERAKLNPSQRSWDLLTLALAVTAADLSKDRSSSPDGWTREFELSVSVGEPDFWNSQTALIEQFLRFLTTDRWRVAFLSGGAYPSRIDSPRPQEDCVTLLSGGLDSLIGCIDLVSSGKAPFAVSQTVRGDAASQRGFAKAIGNLRHLQLNHDTSLPFQENPPSQRARSLIFLAYGVMAATTLAAYESSETITLFVCENGFISVNPPLTDARLGSLTTRTTHPAFLKMVQNLLDAAELHVRIESPYRLKTKGEMLAECEDQKLLSALAPRSTSCGRFKRYGYRHCGRCLPCLVRRGAFIAAGKDDETDYVFEELGKSDADHAGFDDVRAAAMAIEYAHDVGLENWIGPSLSTAWIDNVDDYQSMVARGLSELEELLRTHGVM